MKITYNEFKGTAPKYDPEQLTDGYSVESTNTRPGRGILEPWRNPLGAGTVANNLMKSIYQYNGAWYGWTKDGVSAVKVPVANDPYDTLVIADPTGYPQTTANDIVGNAGTSPAVTHRLGVPIPPTPSAADTGKNPNWTDPGNITEDEYDDSDTTYVIVYVDAWGRVGPSSDPSNTVTLREHLFDNTREITVTLPAAPASLLKTSSRGTTAKTRIYRANYSSSGQGVYQYVAEVDVNTTTYKDTIASGDLLDALATEDWVGPPDDDSATFPNGPVKKFISVASQFIAGHNSRLVCFAEPGTAHAFPARYYQVFSEKVITIHPAGANVIVLTDSYPYVLAGVHPEAMSPTKLSDPAPCSDPRAVTEVNDAVYFASAQAMWVIRGYTIENVTKNFMTESEWKDLDPSNMIFSNYDGRVFMHCRSVGYTMVFDPSDPADGLRRVNFNPQAVAQVDDTNDLAYIEAGTSQIKLFDQNSTTMSLSWDGKKYQFNEPICFSVAKVRANKFPCSVTVHCEKLDGSFDSFTKTVTDDRFFFLPFANRARKWWASVDGSPEIRSIQIGQDPQEFE